MEIVYWEESSKLTSEDINHLLGRIMPKKIETFDIRQCLCCGGVLEYLYAFWMQCRKCGRWERGW